MLPTRTDPRWRKLVENPKQYTYNFLALKILMSRIALKAGSMSSADVDSTIDEVYALFQKHERLMATDIAAVFG